MTCLSMVDSFNKEKVLEVGCGSGIHSELIANAFIKSPGMLVSCDFSNEMVRKMKANYEKSDFTKQSDVLIDTETDHTSSETSTADLPELSSKKIVRGFQVDN